MAVSVVTLPNCDPPTDCTYTLVSKATQMTGPLGGAEQRVLRVGSRFKAAFEFAPMIYDTGRQWLARLNAAEASPAAILFPQRGFTPTPPGAVEVDGPQTPTTNTGGVLTIKGGAAGVELVAGQFFHINASVDGRRYLHQLRDDATIGSDGTVTLAIQPPLRFVPADGDTTEWVNPVMEGFVATGWTWKIAMRNRILISGLSITEDR